MQDTVVDIHQNLTDISATDTVSNSEVFRDSMKFFKAVDVDMDNFLSRPIQISAYTIAHAADSSVALNPWDLFLSEQSVRSKLKNYAFLRATLKVKVVVSGTPFHQGSLLVAKIPFPTFNDVVVAYSGGNAFATRPMFLRYLSQTRDRGILNMHDNIPFEMSFPWVAQQPIGRLYDWNSTAALPSGSAYPDFTNLARLYLYTLNQQLDTSGAATDVFVYVYAWLEDVVLGCPTASPVVLLTEMAQDEREIGPVEKFSSAASRWSKYFVEIPIIGPFAKASQIAFSALASVSSIFGWSVPNVIQRPQRVKNEPFQNACQLIGNDTGQRLTLDPKQEVTVDPNIFGTNKDEMFIRHLASIESLLDQFTWSTTANPMVPIWETLVTPNACKPIVGATTRKVQPTALHFAVQPFRFWRGNIRFKIQVICTQFHRGKFAIIYEPDITKDALIAANMKLNKQYMTIIDISETQEVDFCVEWSTNRLWKAVLDPASDATTGTTITTTALRDYSEYCNGMIYIVPITKLQAPNATNAQINVFISCDDLRVCYPDAGNLPRTTLLTEMPALKRQDGYINESKSDPTMTETSCMILNPVQSDQDHISDIVFGEEVHSFRSLLKKFFFSNSIAATSSAGPFVNRVTFPVWPATTPTPVTNNTTVSSLFAYLRQAYLGMRGGLRKRLEIYGVTPTVMDNVRIALSAPSTVTPAPTVTNSANEIAMNSLTGTVWFVPHTNAGLETEIPYYTNNMFVFASNANTPVPGAFTLSNIDHLSLRSYDISYTYSGTASAGPTYREWTAAAEDFSFGYFIGAPYYRSL